MSKLSELLDELNEFDEESLAKNIDTEFARRVLIRLVKMLNKFHISLSKEQQKEITINIAEVARQHQAFQNPKLQTKRTLKYKLA